MRKARKREFDIRLREALEKNQAAGAAQEFFERFAGLPITTQLAIMRRRRRLSQRAIARRLRVKQPHVARMENRRHDPRLSSVLSQARALDCRIMVVPDKLLARIARMVAKSLRSADVRLR